MRCTQEYGLPEEATKFLDENVCKVPSLCCPKCNHAIYETLDCWDYEDASHLGMFDDGPKLQRYRLKNFAIVEEFVQAVPWSSGPCIFLGLRYENDGDILFQWSEEEINNA